MRSERGSVLLVALILAAVLITATARLYNTVYNELATAHRSEMRTSALYLAEAGLEEAARRIRAGEFDVDPNAAVEKVPVQVVLKPADVNLGPGRTGSQRIIIDREANSKIYTVRSLARVKLHESLEALQAVQSTIELLEGSMKGSGFMIAVRETLKINQVGGVGVRVSSYDSAQNFGTPDWTYNTGFDTALGTASTLNRAIDLANVHVRGSLRTAGGDPEINTSSGQGQAGTRLEGPDTPAGVVFDSNRVAKDFAGKFCVGTAPAVDSSWDVLTGWPTTTTSGTTGNSNPTHGNPHAPGTTGNPHTTTSTGDPHGTGATTTAGTTTISYAVGQPYVSTRVNFPNSMVVPAGEVVSIAGDVVMVVGKDVTFNGTLRLVGDATLRIYAPGTIFLAVECGDWAPSRFQVHSTGTGDVTLRGTTIFTGIVNAPNSAVSVSGTGGYPRMEVRGALSARTFATTNQIDFFYDVQSGDALCDGGTAGSGSATSGSGAGSSQTASAGTGSGSGTSAANDNHVQLSEWKQILAADAAATLPAGDGF